MTAALVDEFVDLLDRERLAEARQAWSRVRQL
jgi:hypothetical protein